MVEDSFFKKKEVGDIQTDPKLFLDRFRILENQSLPNSAGSGAGSGVYKQSFWINADPDPVCDTVFFVFRKIPTVFLMFRNRIELLEFLILAVLDSDRKSLNKIYNGSGLIRFRSVGITSGYGQ